MVGTPYPGWQQQKVERSRQAGGCGVEVSQIRSASVVGCDWVARDVTDAPVLTVECLLGRFGNGSRRAQGGPTWGDSCLLLLLV